MYTRRDETKKKRLNYTHTHTDENTLARVPFSCYSCAQQSGSLCAGKVKILRVHCVGKCIRVLRVRRFIIFFRRLLRWKKEKKRTHVSSRAQ